MPAAAPVRAPARRGSLAAAHSFTSPLAAASVQPMPDPFPGLQPGDDLPEDYGNPGPNPPKSRRAGVVLHPTSLPGKYGMGEIGGEALRFVDWLAETGMQLWQVGGGAQLGEAVAGSRRRGQHLRAGGACPCCGAGRARRQLAREPGSQGKGSAARRQGARHLTDGVLAHGRAADWPPPRPAPPPATLQLLPLVPPETTYWSPYSGLDALCGSTLLIPLEELVGMGLLAREELPEEQPVALHADFTAVAEWKVGAAARLRACLPQQAG